MARFPDPNTDVVSVNFLRAEEDDLNRLVRVYKVETANNVFNTNNITRTRIAGLPVKGERNPNVIDGDDTYVVKISASQTGKNDQVFELRFTYDTLANETNLRPNGKNNAQDKVLMPWQERAEYSEAGRTMSLKLPTDALGRIYQNSTGRPFPEPPSRPYPISVLKIRRNRQFVAGNQSTDSRVMRKNYYKTINDGAVTIGGLTYEKESLLVASFNNTFKRFTYRKPTTGQKIVIPYFTEEVELWYFYVKEIGQGEGWPLVSSILDEGFYELKDAGLSPSVIQEGNYKKFRAENNKRSNKAVKLNGGGKFLLSGVGIGTPPAGVDVTVYDNISTTDAVVLRFDDYTITNFNGLDLNDRLF